jgi:hypothetical protein
MPNPIVLGGEDAVYNVQLFEQFGRDGHRAIYSALSTLESLENDDPVGGINALGRCCP